MADVYYNEGLIYWNDWELPAATPVTVGYEIGIALIENGYSPASTDSSMTAVSGDEVVDSQATPTYARQYLQNRTETIVGGSNWVSYDADNVLWTALITDNPVDGVVLYLTDSTLPVDDADTVLLVYFDVPTVQPNGTDFTVQWDTDGVTTLKQAI